jgi:hypothetical protein
MPLGRRDGDAQSSFRRSNVNTSMPYRLALVAAATLCAGCADHTPSAPSRPAGIAAATANRQSDETFNPELEQALATMRAVTAKYHDLQTALNDGFALRLECGVADEGDGFMGALYANRDRTRDGKIDPALPDGLIYGVTPDGPKLAGIELLMPYALWSDPNPPTFFGATFQREDEPRVFGLHVWLWEHNPNGMFAKVNPRVTC